MVEQSAVNRLVVGSSPTWGVYKNFITMTNNFDKLKIGNKYFNSRLMLGTGKYRTVNDTLNSIKQSECEIVTVAIRRLPTNLENDNVSFLKELDYDDEYGDDFEGIFKKY